MPLLFCVLVNWLLNEFPKVAPAEYALGLVASVLGLVMIVVSTIAQIAVSAMYLRAKNGGVPDVSQFWDALDLPALWPTMLGYVGRMIGWTFILALGGWLGYELWQLVKGAGLSWPDVAIYGVGAGVAVIFFAWVMARYLFVLPLIAMRRDRRGSVVREAVRASGGHAWLLTLLVFGGMVPVGLISVLFNFVLTPHLQGYAPFRWLNLGTSAIANAMTTWLAVLWTELAVRMIPEPAAVVSL